MEERIFDFSPIMDFLNGFISIIESIAEWVINAVLTVVWSGFYFVFDGFLTMIAGVISIIDVSTILTNLVANWGGISPQVAWLINQTGIPQGLEIIGGAYLIRMCLNLIPGSVTRI